jgi:hypothetical protein
MTLRTTSQNISAAGITPASLTPAASDTFTAGCFGSLGMILRVITTGTACDVAVQDPGVTPQFGNPGTVTPVSVPSTGVREILVPVAAVNGGTGVATVTFSGALTGVTYEAKRMG